MTGRVHVVTGAGSGLGLHITTALLGRGDRVVANYASSGDRLTELAEEVGRDRLLPIRGDIAEETTSQELMACAAELGGVAAVIHNASVTRDALLVRMDTDDWDAVHGVNLRGAFLVTKHGVRQMMRARSGRLVYISSISAELGNAGQGNYAASKAGLSGLSRSVAQEYARYGVTSCVLAAGLIAIGMGLRLAPQHQQAKLARTLQGPASPEEMAGVAAYLASEEARLINATVVNVDGGVVF